MKKLFIAIVFMLSAALFAEEFTGIFGIKFGDSPEQVTAIMKKKGCELNSEYSYDSFFMFRSLTTTYAYLNVDDFKFYFEDNKLYKIKIELKSNTDKDKIIDVCNVLIDKFEFKSFETEEYEYYKSGNISFEYGIGFLGYLLFTDSTVEDEILQKEYNLKKQIIELDL